MSQSKRETHHSWIMDHLYKDFHQVDGRETPENVSIHFDAKLVQHYSRLLQEYLRCCCLIAFRTGRPSCAQTPACQIIQFTRILVQIDRKRQERHETPPSCFCALLIRSLIIVSRPRTFQLDPRDGERLQRGCGSLALLGVLGTINMAWQNQCKDYYCTRTPSTKMPLGNKCTKQ